MVTEAALSWAAFFHGPKKKRPGGRWCEQVAGSWGLKGPAVHQWLKVEESSRNPARTERLDKVPFPLQMSGSPYTRLPRL